jgi:hypothetical protein
MILIFSAGFSNDLTLFRGLLFISGFPATGFPLSAIDGFPDDEGSSSHTVVCVSNIPQLVIFDNHLGSQKHFEMRFLRTHFLSSSRTVSADRCPLSEEASGFSSVFASQIMS